MPKQKVNSIAKSKKAQVVPSGDCKKKNHVSPNGNNVVVSRGQVWMQKDDNERRIYITNLVSNCKKTVKFRVVKGLHTETNSESGAMEFKKLLENFIRGPDRIAVTMTKKCPVLGYRGSQTDVFNGDRLVGEVIRAWFFSQNLGYKAFSVYSTKKKKNGQEVPDNFRGYIGYDFDLCEPLSKYFKKDVRIVVHSGKDVRHRQWAIKYPLMYFNEGKAWPPEGAVNWKEGDAINLAPFLVWLGWGIGSTNPPAPEQDNRWEHLVVLKYPNGVAKVVNWIGWQKGTNEGERDPLTNTNLDKSWMTHVVVKMNNDLTNNGWKNRPLPVIPLKYPLCVNDYVRDTEGTDEKKNRIGVITAVHENHTYDIKWCQRRWDIPMDKSTNVERADIARYTVPTFKVGDPVRDLDCKKVRKSGTIKAKNSYLRKKVTYDVCWHTIHNARAIVAMERNVDPAILQHDPEQPNTYGWSRVYSHFEIGDGVETIRRGPGGELQYGVVTYVDCFYLDDSDSDVDDSLDVDDCLYLSYGVRFLHPNSDLHFEGSLAPDKIRRYNGNVWETRDHPYVVGDDVYRVGYEQQTGKIISLSCTGMYKVQWDGLAPGLGRDGLDWRPEDHISHHDLKLNGKNHAFDTPDDVAYKVGAKVIHLHTGRRGKILRAWLGNTYDVEWLNAKYPEKRVSHRDLARQTKYYWSKWVRGRRVRYNIPTVCNDFAYDSDNPVGTITAVGYQGGTKFKIRWDKGGRTMNHDAYDRAKLWLLPDILCV